VEEPSSAGVLVRTTFRTGLQLSYGLSARISSTLAGYYHHDENQGLNGTGAAQPGFSEDSFDLSLNVRYAISGRFTFDVGIQHSEVTSGQTSRDYTRNRYSAGLTFNY
jgi:hypothetical protein